MLNLNRSPRCVAVLTLWTSALWVDGGRADERLIATGRNPDLAVDRAGVVHLVYMAGNSVAYLKYIPNLGLVADQRIVGDGGDAVNADPSSGPIAPSANCATRFCLARPQGQSRASARLAATAPGSANPGSRSIQPATWFTCIMRIGVLLSESSPAERSAIEC
jgi:hypothetical protein